MGSDTPSFEARVEQEVREALARLGLGVNNLRVTQVGDQWNLTGLIRPQTTSERLQTQPEEPPPPEPTSTSPEPSKGRRAKARHAASGILRGLADKLDGDNGTKP